MAGGSKLALGLSAKTQISRAFPSLGAKSLGALGALGGGLAISGIADLATSVLPNYAAIPATAFGGYVVGTGAFQSLGLSAGFAGFVGAGLGLGFGIYGIINNRRRKEDAQRKEAEWYAERSEEISGVISRYSKVLPLIDDEMGRLDRQYNTNLNIIGLNEMENARFNYKTTESIDKAARKMTANLNVRLAQAGFAQQGLGWFLSGEIQDRQIKEIDFKKSRFFVFVVNSLGQNTFAAIYKLEKEGFRERG
jgi:prepilin signal peptidase PulO-like enzyme (type II secretory pathway)